MKSLRPVIAVGILGIALGCDTPWASAKRSREGITWEEWQKGIRTKEQLEQARRDERTIQENARELEMLERQEREQARREEVDRYAAANPNVPFQIIEAIKNRSIMRGMTKEQVIMSWGEPVDKNISVGAFGRHEQWVYRGSFGPFSGSPRYIYFREGVLDSWQTSE